MKSEIYNALATLNRGFDAALESLTVLQQEGVITGDYLQQKTEVAEEMRAGLNHLILNNGRKTRYQKQKNKPQLKKSVPHKKK